MKLSNKAIKRIKKNVRLRNMLALQLNCSVPTVDRWIKENDRKTPRRETVLKIHELFSNLGASEPAEPYHKRRLTLKNNNIRAIPVYEAEPSTLSNVESYRDQPPPETPDFWVTIPQLRDCNYGCRAKGDSMHPLIRTNALVIGKEILDLSVVVFGEVYIIKTKNGIETVKYIHPHESDPEIVLLVPYNGKAKSTPIHKSDILRLFEAKAVFNTL